MLKKPLLLVVLLVITSCSSHSLNNMFGQNTTNRHRNPDMQYLEDDHHPQNRIPTYREEATDDHRPQRRFPTYREEATYAPAPQYHHAQDEYGDDDEDEFDDRPAPRDRCAFYGLTPGTAAHHDCQKQLHKQKRNRYYGR